MKCNYRVEVATMAHAAHLIPNLRRAHLQEVLANNGQPERAVMETFRMSPLCWAAVDEQGVVALWGVAVPSVLCGFGSLWLLGTDRMIDARHRKPFIREVKKFISYARARFPLLTAYQLVDTVNERWLEWVGFELSGYTTISGHEYFQLTLGQKRERHV